jgi:hypothetical protein
MEGSGAVPTVVDLLFTMEIALPIYTRLLLYQHVKDFFSFLLL